MIIQTQLVSIDNSLRFALFGLECVLDAEFSVNVVEKIFSDGEDAVSEKRCTLWTVKRQIVTGYVDGYEPEDIWITVQNPKPFSPSLATIVERAKYQAHRLISQSRIPK